MVIIVNYRQSELTAACIRSLQKAHSSEFCIVVIDNGSGDGSSDRLQAEFTGQVDFIAIPKNLGFTGGNNIGIRYALDRGADYVLLLNNDTVVAADFLEPLVKALQTDRKRAAATGKIYYLHQPETIWAAGGQVNLWTGEAGNRGANHKDRGRFDHPGEIGYSTGCFLLMSRKAIEEVGLLDDAFFAYYEDADWCLRARQAGYTIWYEPSARIWHVAGASLRNTKENGRGQISPLTYYLNIRNHLWFINRYSHGIKRITALGYFTFRYLLFYSFVFIILGRIPKLRALWKGAREGLMLPAPASPNGG